MFDEDAATAWRERFGAAPPVGLPPIDKFLTHRSVRKYKSDPVSEGVVKGLIAAAQSAATSSNLQLWSVISVQNPETRSELAGLCDNYRHIQEAAWFFAFIADHYRLHEAAKKQGEQAAGLDFAEFFIMAVIDAALAAERMVCAAESIGLGICYIGALRNNAVEIKRILDLPERTFGVFGLCIGWPEEPLTAEIKPRLSQEAIWFREKYKREVPIDEYDGRMKGFYESQKMKGDVTWSMRSGRRVDNDHLTGREILREWLEEQGFNHR